MSEVKLIIFSSLALASILFSTSPFLDACTCLNKNTSRFYPKSMSLSSKQAKKWKALSGAVGKGQGYAKQAQNSSSFHSQNSTLLEHTLQNSHSSMSTQSLIGSSSGDKAKMYLRISMTRRMLCQLRLLNTQSSCNFSYILDRCQRAMKSRVDYTRIGRTHDNRIAADLADYGLIGAVSSASLSCLIRGCSVGQTQTSLIRLIPLLNTSRQRYCSISNNFCSILTQRALQSLTAWSSTQSSTPIILSNLQNRALARTLLTLFCIYQLTIFSNSDSIWLLKFNEDYYISRQSIVFTAKIKWSAYKCRQYHNFYSNTITPHLYSSFSHKKLSASNCCISCEKYIQLYVRRLGIQVQKYVEVGYSSIRQSSPAMNESMVLYEECSCLMTSLWAYVLSRLLVSKQLVMRCCWQSVGQSMGVNWKMERGEAMNFSSCSNRCCILCYHY